MKILVKRESGRNEAAKSTHSLVEVWDGDQLVGTFRGLEPDFDEVKEAGDSRIPEGTYLIGIRHKGRMVERYYNRFPDWFKGMLHVLNVSNYEFIYIHIGNYETDTQGCLLIGKNKVGDMVTRSVSAFKEFYQLVVPFAKSGDLEITYTDEETTS